MSIGRSDNPIKRYIIHAFMIFFGLLAIVPVYILMINATRTVEQINTGLSIVPPVNAFISSSDTIKAYWEGIEIIREDADGEPFSTIVDYDSGTIRYLDLIMGATLKEVTNPKTKETEKRVVNIRTESRQPRLGIYSDNNEALAVFNLSDNAHILVENGERVKKGQTLANIIIPSNVIANWKALNSRGNLLIWNGFLNSAIIAICTTVLSIYFSALTAYGLHVYRFRGRTAIWVIILVIMMLPGSLTFIGFYKQMATWALTDTYIPLIIPSIAAAATVLFIRQYMSSVLSLELVDAARIDGAGEYRIFNTIIIPVIIPALAAQAIFTFVGSWNSFVTPLVIITSESKRTLPLVIALLHGDIYRPQVGGIYLGVAISLIPIIIFYSLMSRFIISGITMGGIKE